MLTLITKQHNAKIDLDSIYSCVPLYCIIASGHQKITGNWIFSHAANSMQHMHGAACLKMGLLSVPPWILFCKIMVSTPIPYSYQCWIVLYLQILTVSRGSFFGGGGDNAPLDPLNETLVSGMQPS